MPAHRQFVKHWQGYRIYFVPTTADKATGWFMRCGMDGRGNEVTLDVKKSLDELCPE